VPMVQVTMVEGRTVEQKHALIREITDGVVKALDVPAERVRIVIYEVTGEDWGIGGQPYSAVRPLPGADPT
jgi:4-oxalocrotonate tautomerase